MSLDPERTSKAISEEGLGSLRGCLVEGDPEERRRERSIRRRSLGISIVMQSAVLAALILVPLFGKTQRIAYAYLTPIPPYSPYRPAAHIPRAQPPGRNGPQDPCRFCIRPIPSTIAEHVSNSTGSETSDNAAPEGIGEGITGIRDGQIRLGDPRQQPLPPNSGERKVSRPQILHVTSLDPAMLVHRVEPVYPPLAKQVHREGRVELRAIIGTDGLIQSLQIVAGDPLLERSAVEAVQQWRYKPTILNGQAVEIDTYITVIYTMQH